jgi:hypothetical protein
MVTDTEATTTEERALHPATPLRLYLILDLAPMSANKFIFFLNAVWHTIFFTFNKEVLADMNTIFLT